MKFYYSTNDERSRALIGKYFAEAYASKDDEPDEYVGIILALMRANRARILKRHAKRIDENAIHGWRIVMKKARLRNANAWAARFIAYVAEKRGFGKGKIAGNPFAAYVKQLAQISSVPIKPIEPKRLIEIEEEFVRMNLHDILADIEWLN